MMNYTPKIQMALLATGFAIAAGYAMAQQLNEIVVETPRVERAKERTMTGAPIDIITVTHRVAYNDLDISTHSGAVALEARVKDSAKSACKEIEKLYPLMKSAAGDADCERTAVNKAMVQANEAISKAERTAKQ